MKYIKRNNEGVLIVDKSKEAVNCGLVKYLDALCNKELSTYKGRLKSVKKIFGINKNIPLYINKNTLCFPTCSPRDYMCFYINYYKVLSCRVYTDTKTEIIFDDLSSLLIEERFSKIYRQMEKCKTINSYVNK